MAANSPPQVDLNGSAAGTGTSLAFTENDRPTRIAPAAIVTDPDSPDFAGGTLTVRITAGAGPNDQLRVLEGTFALSEQDILYRTSPEQDPITYVRIGTLSGGTDGSTPLVITLTDEATPSLVQELVRSIGFANFSDAPIAGQRTIVFTLTDGDGGTSAPVEAGVAVKAIDDPSVAVPDHVYAVADTVATGSVFADNGEGPDSDPDGTITVSEVNGTASVGKTIQLASGALLTVNADGTYVYDPNHAFDALAAAQTGGANSTATDNFTYTLEGGESATVQVTVYGAYDASDIVLGDEEANELRGTQNGDLFVLTQGGSDSVAGNGGNDYVYFGAEYDAGDRVDGGAGFDVVALQGNYQATLGTLTGVERLTLLSGFARGGGETAYDYTLTATDQTVRAGETLQVLATGLAPGETLVFNGTAEKDGSFDVRGGADADTIAGGGRDDVLSGGGGDDQLYGLGGADRLVGGDGADQLRGGFGADRFVYLAATDSTARAFDRILDFEDKIDRIDLSGIDADPTAQGDQAFTFIGSAAFGGHAGELRAFQLEGSTWAVEGDVNGDGTADLYIQVTVFNGHVMAGSDFVL